MTSTDDRPGDGGRSLPDGPLPDGPLPDLELPDLELRLPERGTGARAARRAARAAAAEGADEDAPPAVGEQRPPGAGRHAPRTDVAPTDRSAGAPVEPARSREAPPAAVEQPPAATSAVSAATSAGPVRRRRQPLVASVDVASAAGASVEPAGAPSSPSSSAPAAVPGPSRRWMTGFAAVLALSVVLAAMLTVVGVTTLRESNAGRRVTSADPSEPGFEGLLEPTPTLLVVHQSDGVLRSAALLSLAKDDAGGSVLLLPPSVEVGDGEGATPLSVTFAFNGAPDVVRGAGEAIAGVGVQEIVILDDTRWAELVAPVAPLAIDNPDAVPGFESGLVTLGADEVATWLGARGRDESELAALVRQQLFWEAWVKAVAASDDPAAVPGELDSGVGRFVRGLAGGRLSVASLPVLEGPGAGESPTLRVDRTALRAVITDLVPFPTGTALAPRTRVRLLDGAGQDDHVQAVAPAVVAADSTIVVVGNADAFDYRTTEIRYHQPGQRAAAERLQQALGAGTVVKDVRPIDAFDVTIVLGTDT